MTTAMERTGGHLGQILYEFLSASQPTCATKHPVAPLALEPVAAGAMKLRVRIGGVDQHIGVNGEH